jgi:P pilus assembly chaperone PapD
VRLADLKIITGSGTLSVAKGLAGYVLPRSTMTWTVDRGLKGAKMGGTVSISALTEHGTLQATGTIQAAQ